MTSIIGLFGSSLAIETIFYLPNHFRQTVLVNSNNISFVKSDAALLDLMNYMFHLNTNSEVIQEFRIAYFLRCYSHFWTSVLPYETLSFCSRSYLFSQMRDQIGYLPAGFIAGATG